jgi:hypothetical protein
MRENIQDIYGVLISDETLLRLLYYLPEDANDSPLSPTKQNILSMPELEKWSIISDVIKTSAKTDDLTFTPKCRLFIYPGRRGSTNNYLFADQRIIFDVLVHFDYEDVDLRLEWICDTVNELIFNQRITGMGKVLFEIGEKISAPEGYVGYRLIYSFSSENG